MANNQDHFSKGTRVKLSVLGAAEFPQMKKWTGEIVSPYPVAQIVSVKWNEKKSKDRFHIDFLTPIKKART